MEDDAETTEGTTSEEAGSAAGQTQDQKGSDPAAEIASYRRRQAGAEAARQTAETRAKDLEAQLAKYEEANQTAAQKDLSELAATQARLEAAEKRATEAEAKAEARVLDAKFPNARKELPEVTDEVRLAKFEAMLTDGDFEPPTPKGHNESKTGSRAGSREKPMTSADIEAKLLATPLPPGW